MDGEFGWGVGGGVDLDHGSPLGEARTKSVVLLGSLVKIVESLKEEEEGGLVFGCLQLPLLSILLT